MSTRLAMRALVTLPLVLSVWSSHPALTAAKAFQPPHAYQTDPSTAAFSLSAVGGLRPSAYVTVAVNGHVTATGRAQLSNPTVQLNELVVQQMLRLAEADGFFGRPAKAKCFLGGPDLPVVTMSFYLRTGTVSRSLKATCFRSDFSPLLEVLLALTSWVNR